MVKRKSKLIDDYDCFGCLITLFAIVFAIVAFLVHYQIIIITLR